MDVRSRPGLLVLGGAALAVVGSTGLILAGQGRAASVPPCAIAASSVVAGRPLDLSGPMPSSGGLVDIVARNERGYLREGNDWQEGSRWRGSITFRPTDAGLWTLEIRDGATSCRSPLQVTLAAGATAPTVGAGFVDESLVPPPPIVEVEQVMTWLAIAAVVLVLGSGLVLALVGGAAVLGRRPLARPRVRRLARGATFVAVLGGVAGAALFLDFVVSMSNFDMGTPEPEQTFINVVIGLSVIAGAMAGAAASRRIHEPS